MIDFKTIKDICNYSIKVPFLVGPSGVGKTDFAKQFAAHVEMPLLCLNLSTVEACDFTGRNIVASGETVWAKPNFLNHSGVLFLDEITCVSDSQVKAALKSLLVDRKINEHELLAKYVIVAGNEGEDYDVYDFDTALKDRVVRIDFINDMDRWSQYETSLRPSQFITFCVANSKLATQFSFRSLTEANKVFKATSNTEALRYMLNASFVSLFEKSFKSAISLKDVLKGDFAEQDLKNLDLVVVNLVCQELADFFETKDLTSKQLKNIELFIQNINAENQLSFFTFVEAKLNKEIANFDDKVLPRFELLSKGSLKPLFKEFFHIGKLQK